MDERLVSSRTVAACAATVFVFSAGVFAREKLTTDYIATVGADGAEVRVYESGFNEGISYRLDSRTQVGNTSGSTYYNYVVDVPDAGRFWAFSRPFANGTLGGVSGTYVRSCDSEKSSARRYLYPMFDDGQYLRVGVSDSLATPDGVERAAIVHGWDANPQQGKATARYWQACRYDWAFEATYAANGGSGDELVESFTNRLVLADCPYARRGYVFSGWKYGGRTYEPGDEVAEEFGEHSQDPTVVAQWEGVPYSIRFVKGDDLVTGSMPDLEAVFGRSAKLSVCAFELVGHRFVGWATEPGGEVIYGDQDTVSDLTDEAGATFFLYAVWDNAQFAVNFDAAGGRVSPMSKTVTYSRPYGPLPVPTHAEETDDCWVTRYVFDGWYHAGAAISSESQVSYAGPHTLTARWNQEKVGREHVIEFSTAHGETPAPMTIRYGDLLEELPTPVEDGHLFGDWWLGERKVRAGVSLMLTNDVTFVASWTTNAYALICDFNGGSNGTASVTAVYGQPMPAITSGPVRVGYEFLGYFDAPTEPAREVYRSDLQAVDTIWTNLCDVTVYAQWRRIPKVFSVTFDFGEGFEPAVTNVTEGRVIRCLPEAPAREGHRIAWWYETERGRTARVTERTVVTNDLCLTAQWTQTALNETFGIEGLAFETDETGGWFPEVETEYLPSELTRTARSGAIAVEETSTLLVYAPTRGTLSFNWALDIDGETKPRNHFNWMVEEIPGSMVSKTGVQMEWADQHETTTFGSGFVKWVYEKRRDATVADRCWIADLSWLPDCELLPLTSWDVAVDNPQLAFVTDGDQAWGVTAREPWYADGTNGLVTAEELADGQASEVRLSATGPKLLRFKWRTSCESGECARDRLEFLIDGIRQAAIDGMREDFEEFVSAVPPGEHTLVWRYQKDDAGWDGEDRAFLDSVSLEPLVPEAVTARLRGNSVTNGYDGSVHVASGYRVVSVSDSRYTADDIVFSGSAHVSATDAGVYPMGLSSADFANANGLFAVTFEVEDGELVIEKADQHPLASRDFSVVVPYDGAPHAVSPSLIASAFVGRTATDVSFSADREGPWQTEPIVRTSVGTTSYWFRVAGDGNYWDYLHEACVTVQPPPEVTVTVTGHWVEAIYDGTPKTSTGFDFTSSVGTYGVDDFAFTGCSNVTRIAVGRYPFGLLPSDFSNVNPNYASVRFVVRDGGLLVGAAKMASEEPGSGSVPEGGVSKFDVSVDYDRAYHAVDAAGIVDAFTEAYGPCVVTFSTSEEGPWSEEAPAFLTVGSRTLWYRVSADNYETYVHSVRVEIRGDAITAEVGRYFGMTLGEMGIELPASAGVTWSVKAAGLPKGLSLKVLKQKTGNQYCIEGVPSESADSLRGRNAYLRVTRKEGKASRESIIRLPLDVLSARTVPLPDGILSVDYGRWTVAELWPESAGASYSGWPSGLTLKKGVVSGKPKKAGVFTVTATVKNVPSRFTKTKYSEKLKATLMVNPGVNEFGIRYTNQAYVVVSMPSFDASWPGLKSISGLPTGLKYNSSSKPVTTRKRVGGRTVTVTNALPHEIYGKPTKTGVFAVKLTLADPDRAKKTLTRQILWRITPGENNGITLAGKSLGGGTSIIEVGVGLPLDWSVGLEAGAKVTVSGVPTGMKYKDGHLSGVPTKGGNYVLTFKTVRNGVTVIQRVAVTVTALPSRLVGTYYGLATSVCDGVDSGGRLTVTVSSSGKISGSFYRQGKKVSFKASSFDRYDEGLGAYVARIAYTYDRVKHTGVELLFRIVDRTDLAELWQVTLGSEGGMLKEADAFRNQLKDLYGKLPKALAKTHSILGGGLASGEYLKAKVSTSGAVTVSGKLANAEGRLVSVSGSTQLVPVRSDLLAAPVSLFKTVSRGTPVAFDGWWELEP